MYAIETTKLTKRLWQRTGIFNKQQITAVNDVNIKVSDGEVFGILGKNGAGKTTILRLLSGLMLPTEGTAKIFGYDLINSINAIKRITGVVLNNERSFYWRLTVRQNLEFFAALYDVPSNLARKRIDELLEILELKDSQGKWVEVLSLGMKQRLSIARGLLSDPRIILMDEPTRGLDPFITQRIWDFIKQELVVKRKKTIIICTNYLEEAAALCERVSIIDKGEVKGIIDAKGASLSLKDAFNNLVM